MSDDLDVELTPDESPDEDAHACYFDEVTAEHRRYIALDMARLIGPLPDKTLKLAQDIEKFLLGKAQGPRAVE
jgi:hypothetical protein